jgi:hypothetical protein
MTTVNIVLPECDRSEVSEGLRRLVVRMENNGVGITHGFLGGLHGYGADWDTPVFFMKPFCWCDKDDCPWCAGCTCEHIYSVDGQDVDYERWIGVFRDAVKGLQWGSPACQAAVENTHGRRSYRKAEPRCEFCKTGGPAANHGGGPELNAPNFWHKVSGLQVRWYKWIGRDMKIINPAGVLWKEVEDQCAAEIVRCRSGSN